MSDPSSIYPLIDKLKRAKTVSELLKDLVPILEILAYHAVNGEGAVGDVHEDWHTEYRDALISEAVRDAKSTPIAAPPPPVATSSASVVVTSRQPVHKLKNRADARAAALAPKPEDSLPESLRQIMKGTHPSFREPND